MSSPSFAEPLVQEGLALDVRYVERRTLALNLHVSRLNFNTAKTVI